MEADTRLYIDPSDPTAMPRRWVSAGELAQEFGISVWSVRRAIRAGRLRTRAITEGTVRIDITSVPAARRSPRRSA